MGRDDYIESAMRGVLKNPILGVLREIGIAKMLRQSNFVKREVGHPPFQILLHFVYMLVMNKRQSAFVKQSGDAFGKDAYYRFVKHSRYNWRKLLMFSAAALIRKVEPLHGSGEQRVLIIDDTVEPKRGKQIEGSCRYLWSNKEHRLINGVNLVTLNYADTHSTFQLDFAVRHGSSRRKEIADFTSRLHHRSNAYRRRTEGLEGKNVLALEMVARALEHGIDADYLLTDSWHPKGTSVGRTPSPTSFIKPTQWACPSLPALPIITASGTSKANTNRFRPYTIITEKAATSSTVCMERFATAIST